MPYKSVFPIVYSTIDEEITKYKYDICKFMNEKDFLNELSTYLCTDWYKDYDNEYAWELTELKVKNDFIELRKHYCDDIIFAAVQISCNFRYDYIEAVKDICELIKKRLVIRFTPIKIKK